MFCFVVVMTGCAAGACEGVLFSQWATMAPVSALFTTIDDIKSFSRMRS